MTLRAAYELTVEEAAQALRAGRLAPSDLVEACLGRSDACEPKVQAWAQIAHDDARMDARLQDTTAPGGPLRGIPFGIKDIIEVASLTFERGTPIYRRATGTRDAAAVALLKEAGGVCLGKTVTTELAHFHPGKTRNPHRLTHTPGGSSSGSAAAVAAGCVPVALGTQTTGSVLRPAAFCGVFGFKPSYGDVSCSGVMACATSFDTVGWFTRSVADVEIVRQALLRTHAGALETTAVGHLRVGLFMGPYWDVASDDTRAFISGAADSLARAGAKITTVDPPAGFETLADHHRTVSGFEFARAITWERREHAAKLSPKLVDGRCRDGLECSYDDYAAAQDALCAARRACAALHEDVDVLLTPVAPAAATDGLCATGDPVFNTAWTALGVPALSVPAFRDQSGLPLGLQLVGAYRRDHRMLTAARAIEAHFDVETVRPVDV